MTSAKKRTSKQAHEGLIEGIITANKNSDATLPGPMHITETELMKVPFSKLDVDPETYSYRDAKDFHKRKLDTLAGDIGLHGINTPLLVTRYLKDMFRVLDGHRRYHAIKQKIAEKAVGFDENYLVPVHVLTGDVSEQDKLVRAVSANIMREPLPPEGRMKAAVALDRTHMAIKDIARLMCVSEGTIGRDIALGRNDELMKLVRNNYIPASTAATLLKVAAHHNRVPDLIEAIRQFGAEAEQTIRTELKHRKALKAKPLSEAEQRPSKYLTSEQIRTWDSNLKSGEDLGEPTFEFFAGITKNEKTHVKRLEIAAVDLPVDDLTVLDLVKVVTGMSDGLIQVASILRAKQQSGNSSSVEPEDSQAAALRILTGLGLAALVNVKLDHVEDEPAEETTAEDESDSELEDDEYQAEDEDAADDDDVEDEGVEDDDEA